MLGILLLWGAEPIITRARDLLGDGLSGAILGEFVLSFAVFFLPTLAMGATFSHLAQAVRGHRGGLGRGLASNTLGGSLAPLVFGVVLLPLLGSKWSLLFTSFGYVLLFPPRSRSGWIPALPAALASILLISAADLKFVTPPPGGRILEHVEGVMAAVTVVEDRAGENYLKVNNKFQMGGTATYFSDRRQGHIPLLLHPDPHKALFLGVGTGATFAAAADYRGLEADGVELIPEVLQLLPHFEKSTGDFRQYPNLHFVVADARRYVNACGKNYDVVVGDLFHPARDGAGFLYTVEHFRAVRSLLNEGGIFCQWLPIYQLDLDVLKIIIRTFLEVFPDATAFLAHYSLRTPILGLVACKNPLLFPENWFTRRIKDPLLSDRLKRLRLSSPYELFGCFVADCHDLAYFAGEGPVNTDDDPVVMFKAPRFAYTHEEPAYERLFALLNRFSPRPDQILALSGKPEDAETSRRLAAYWDARNAFLFAGVGVPQTGDVGVLLKIVREPLLSVVRRSSDFGAAYDPLLAMAEQLFQKDPEGARNLLLDLCNANPSRAEAHRLLDKFFSRQPS
jgi:spermidine synthase